jgi:hypothetical protein
MSRYSICVVSKEYRYITVEAETEEQAKDQVWDKIDGVLSWKAEDWDTGLYVDAVEEISVSDETRSYGPQGANHD